MYVGITISHKQERGKYKLFSEHQYDTIRLTICEKQNLFLNRYKINIQLLSRKLKTPTLKKN